LQAKPPREITDADVLKRVALLEPERNPASSRPIIGYSKPFIGATTPFLPIGVAARRRFARGGGGADRDAARSTGSPAAGFLDVRLHRGYQKFRCSSSRRHPGDRF